MQVKLNAIALAALVFTGGLSARPWFGPCANAVFGVLPQPTLLQETRWNGFH